MPIVKIGLHIAAPADGIGVDRGRLAGLHRLRGFLVEPGGDGRKALHRALVDDVGQGGAGLHQIDIGTAHQGAGDAQDAALVGGRVGVILEQLAVGGFERCPKSRGDAAPVAEVGLFDAVGHEPADGVGVGEGADGLDHDIEVVAGAREQLASLLDHPHALGGLLPEPPRHAELRDCCCVIRHWSHPPGPAASPARAIPTRWFLVVCW